MKYEPRRRLILSMGISLGLALASLHAGADTTQPPLKFYAEPFPPFSYEENGKPAGPLVEVVQAVCHSANLPCAIEIIPWRRIMKLADAGMLDGVCMVARIPEREQVFFITDDVALSSFTFFTQQVSQFKYRQPHDLDGSTIGVYGPSGTSATLEELNKDAGAKVELEVDNVTALRKLAAGRYGVRGAILINRDVARVLITENGIEGVVAAGDAKIISYAIGLSRAAMDVQRAELFNAKLRALKRAGVVRGILQKHGITAAP